MTAPAIARAIGNNVFLAWDPPVIASIAVSPSPATLAPGETQQFTAQAYDLDGNEINADILWSVPSAAGTINSAGLFTAGADEGTWDVTATSGAISGTSAVTVEVPFQMTDISNMEFGFEAWRLGLSAGAACGAATDLSGHGDATSAGSKRPVNRLGVANGKDALEGDGVDDYMETPALPSVAARTIFLVAKVISPTTNGVIAALNSHTRAIRDHTSISPHKFSFYFDLDDVIGGGDGWVEAGDSDVFGVITLRTTAAGSGNGHLLYNGVEIATFDGSDLLASNKFTMFDSANPAVAPSNSQIAAAFSFGKNVTGSELSDAHTYLLSTYVA